MIVIPEDEPIQNPSLGDRIEYFFFTHPLLAKYFKYPIALLLAPFSPFHARVIPQGEESQYTRDRMVWVKYHGLEQQIKRRKSLTDWDRLVGLRGLFRKKFCDQRQSGLFDRLPREVRERIFGFVMSEWGVVHVGMEKGGYRLEVRRGCYLLPEKKEEGEGVGGQVGDGDGEDDDKDDGTITRHLSCLRQSNTTIKSPVKMPWTSPLGLMQSCRRIYAEVQPLLYQDNAFHFQIYTQGSLHFASQSPFSTFTRSISPNNLSRIRTLVLFTWKKFPLDCLDWKLTADALHRMDGLRDCRIIFGLSGVVPHPVLWEPGEASPVRKRYWPWLVQVARSLENMPRKKACVLEMVVSYASVLEPAKETQYQLVYRRALKDCIVQGEEL